MVDFLLVIAIIYLVGKILTSIMFLFYSLFLPFKTLFTFFLHIPFYNKKYDKGNKASLEFWYYSQITSLRYKSKFYLLIGLLTLILLLFFVNYRSLETYQEYGHLLNGNFWGWLGQITILKIEYTVQFLLLLSTFFYCYIVYKKTFKGFTKDELKHEVLELKNIPKLWEITNNLLNKMKIREEIKYLKINSNTYFPSVIRIKKQVYIKLPIGFFILLITNPIKVEAILAHEFSHIKQKDENYWLFADLIIEETQNALFKILPFILVIFSPFLIRDSILLWEMYQLTPDGLESIEEQMIIPLSKILIVPFIIGALDDFRLKIVSYRRKSEELADTAAIIFSDGNVLLDVLKEQGVEIHTDTYKGIEKIVFLKYPTLNGISSLLQLLRDFFSGAFLWKKGVDLKLTKQYQQFRFKVHPPMDERIINLKEKIKLSRMTK